MNLRGGFFNVSFSFPIFICDENLVFTFLFVLAYFSVLFAQYENATIADTLTSNRSFLIIPSL